MAGIRKAKKVKNPQQQLTARKNPWLNFLREYRNKNAGNYKTPGSHTKLMVDASVEFRKLTPEQKTKYNEYIEPQNTAAAAAEPVKADAPMETSEDEVPEVPAVGAKKGRGKK